MEVGVNVGNLKHGRQLRGRLVAVLGNAFDGWNGSVRRPNQSILVVQTLDQLVWNLDQLVGSPSVLIGQKLPRLAKTCASLLLYPLGVDDDVSMTPTIL